MSERIYVAPGPANVFLVIFEEPFHFKSLYILMHEWLLEEGWKSCQGAWENEGLGGKYSDLDIYHETMFYDNRSPGNKKMWIWWRLQKKTESSFLHYFMNINFMMLGLRDAEGVNSNGVKFQGQVGELTITIRPWMEVDYGDKWTTHPFLKYTYPFYRKRIMAQDLLKKEELFLRDTQRYIGVIKKFLEHRTFEPEAEIFYESRRKFG